MATLSLKFLTIGAGILAVRVCNHVIWTFLPSHNLLVFDDTPFQRYHLVRWKSKGEVP